MTDQTMPTPDHDYANLRLAQLALSSGNLIKAAGLYHLITTASAREELVGSFEEHFQELPFNFKEILKSLQTLDGIFESSADVDAASVVTNRIFTDPLFWNQLAPNHGLKFLNWLVAQGQWDAVPLVLEAIEAAHVGRIDLTPVYDTLAAHHDQARELALMAMTTGDYQAALKNASYVLSFVTHDLEMRMARGEALRHLGKLQQACSDFQFIVDHGDATEVRGAALRIVELCIRMDNYPLAAETIRRIDPDEETKRLEEVIERHLQRWPYIMVCAADRIVMHDTLQPVPGQIHHAWFAVAVQSASRADNSKRAAEAMLSESFQFSNLIGSLYHTEGEPVFALRFIREAGHEPSGDSLRVALLCRVSAEQASEAHRLALELWNQISHILPGARSQMYQYEPVSEADELQHLLTPFDVLAVT